jgi:ABC-type branched-subunit amino acid transport system substrate-binding protein
VILKNPIFALCSYYRDTNSQGGELMRRPRILWILGIGVALLAVVAVACGDDEEEEVTPAAETPAAETPAAETPEVVTEEVPGVTDTEIVIGTHMPLTGPVAVYSQIATATKAYFEYINDTEGGVHGRTVTLLIEDDQYSPPLTVEVIRRLVEQENVFAILGGLGTATHMQVVDFLMERGVPDFFVSTGALEWVRDPEARPNVFGILPNYIAEGIVLGKYAADNFAGGKLGFIGQNDDFGLDGFEGVTRGVGDALEILDMETFESTDPDVNSQVDRLQSAGADVIVVYATPAQAPAAIRHARADLGWDVPILMSTVSASELTIALTGAENIEGVITVEALKHAYDTDDPAIQKHAEIISEYAGLENPGNLTMYGQSLAEGFLNVLEAAGPDLTREGLIAAAESAPAFTCSVCLFASELSPTDHDSSQSVALSRAELDPDDPVGARWVFIGDAYTWEGVNPDEMTVDDIEAISLP